MVVGSRPTFLLLSCCLTLQEKQTGAHAKLDQWHITRCSASSQTDTGSDLMDVWDHYCHPTPFQEEMIHVPAYTSWEMAPTSAIYVWKKGWDQLNTCQHCFARQCEPILKRSFSHKAGSKRTCCSVLPFHFMCVFPRLWVRLIYTHSAAIVLFLFNFFRWSATLTL